MRKNYQVTAGKIQLPFRLKKRVLALGPQAKNTLCFAEGKFAYFSPRHENLTSLGDYLNFTKHVQAFLRRKPQVIAYDLHPEYLSTKYAYQLSAISLQFSAVQHHHAHIASCMAENGLQNKRVIGVAFDGTGWGSDDTFWGSEFLLCNYKNFARVAHLKEIPLLGGEKAISQPWRAAAAWLYLIYRDKFLNLGIDFSKAIDKKSWWVLREMYLKRFNTPLASSMGRLFDAVASVILVKYKVNFEAELAIGLEKLASSSQVSAPSYAFDILKAKDRYVLEPAPIFRQIIRDLTARQTKEKIAYRFHLTVAEMVRKTCVILRKNTQINTVVLSGGVFQNNLLLRLALDLLYKEGLRVFTQRKLSCDDSGIALGQAVAAGL
jgi:hydrogenase maturation protein HypF